MDKTREQFCQKIGEPEVLRIASLIESLLGGPIKGYTTVYELIEFLKGGDNG
jgi:hypothetical protein